ADACGGEIQRRGRAEPAGADQEDLRVEQLELALFADLGDEDVAAVALALRGVERARQLGGESAALPVGVAPRERGHVLVAELPERLRRERRARTAGAVEEDRLRPVGHRLLDARLEEPARDVDRARDAALRPFVELAHVHDEGPIGAVEDLGGAWNVDLVDLGLHLRQQVAIARHDYPKYSDLHAG